MERRVRYGRLVALACLPTLVAWFASPPVPGGAMLFDRAGGMSFTAEIRDPGGCLAWVLREEALWDACARQEKEFPSDMPHPSGVRLRSAFHDAAKLVPHAVSRTSVGVVGENVAAVAVRLSPAAGCLARLTALFDESRLTAFVGGPHLTRTIGKLGLKHPTIAFSGPDLIVYDTAILPGVPRFEAPALGGNGTPGRGISLRLTPDEALRARLRKNGVSSIRGLHDLRLEVTLEGRAIVHTARADLAAEPFERLQKWTERRYGEAEPLTALPMPDGDDAFFRLSASMPFPAFWTGLARVLFDAEMEPTAAWSNPLTVLAWRACEQGIVREATGAFSAAAYPAHPHNLPGILPVPRLEGTVAVRDARRAFDRFTADACVAVDYFRRPTGPELWLAVREDTRLTVTAQESGGTLFQTADLALHPLFFHGKAPRWAGARDAENLLWWGLDSFALPSIGSRTARPQALETDVFVHADMVWDVPDAELAGLQTLCMDKIEHAALAPRAYTRPVAEAFRVLRKLAAVSRRGTWRMTLREGGPAARAEDGRKKVPQDAETAAFHLDTHGRFELNQALIENASGH